MQSKILSIIRMGCGEISLQIFNLKYIGVLKTCDLCPDLLFYKWVLWKVCGGGEIPMYLYVVPKFR